MSVEAITVTTHLAGAAEMEAALGRFETRVARKAVSRAVRAGSDNLLDAVKARAPILTGTLKGALQVRRRKRRQRGGVEDMVAFRKRDMLLLVKSEYGPKRRLTRGPRKGEMHGRRAFYPAIVEFGVKRGPHKFAGRHYMERAFDARKESAAKVVMDVLAFEIERAKQEAGLKR